jgi:nitrite reductase (NAD(P)H)
MVGDTSDFVKLVALVKKKVCIDFAPYALPALLISNLSKKALEVPPSQFILGTSKSGGDDGADLDDDTQICSCHVSWRRTHLHLRLKILTKY